MNAFDKAIKDNGFAVVDGVKYAIGQEPYLDNYTNNMGGTGVGYKAYGFTEEMLNEDGEHEPGFDETVELIWDCSEWHEAQNEYDDFDCDWENDAFIN